MGKGGPWRLRRPQHAARGKPLRAPNRSLPRDAGATGGASGRKRRAREYLLWPGTAAGADPGPSRLGDADRGGAGKVAAPPCLPDCAVAIAQRRGTGNPLPPLRLNKTWGLSFPRVVSLQLGIRLFSVQSGGGEFALPGGELQFGARRMALKSVLPSASRSPGWT